MHDKELQKTLSERFDGYGSTPSESVWSGIEAGLAEKDRRRGAFWWWIGIAGAAVIGFFTFIHFANTPEVAIINASNWRHQASSEIGKTQENGEMNARDLSGTDNSGLDNGAESSANNSSTNSTKTGNWTTTNNNNNNNNNNNQHTYSAQTFQKRDDKTNLSQSIDEQSRIDLPLEYSSDNEKESRKKLTLSMPTKPLGSLSVPVFNEIISSRIDPIKRTGRWELAADLGTFTPYSEFTPPVEQEPIQQDPGGITDQLIDQDNGTSLGHRRFVELQVTARRYFGRRFSIGLGASGAYGRNSISDQYNEMYNWNIWSVGIPFNVRFDAFSKGRFRISPYVQFLNEMSFASLNNPVYWSSFTSTADPLLPEGGTVNSRKYSLGIQPSIELSYALNERFLFTTSLGYRYHALNRKVGLMPLLEQPNYLRFSIGTAWLIK